MTFDPKTLASAAIFNSTVGIRRQLSGRECSDIAEVLAKCELLKPAVDPVRVAAEGVLDAIWVHWSAAVPGSTSVTHENVSIEALDALRRALET